MLSELKAPQRTIGSAGYVSGYSISETSARLGLTVRALRYYEQVGLVKAGRTSQNRRVYGRQTLRDLEAIARLRRAGIDLETVAWVLQADDEAIRTDRMSVAAAQRLEALNVESAALRALIGKD